MHSNWSEYSHRRQYSDKRSRQWDDSKEWEDGREPHRDNPRDSYQKYRGDGHSNTDRMCRSREYSKDSLSRDWSRKSPPRRRMSPPVSDGAEKKWRRFAEDSDYRYRHESPEKTHRLSPEGFSYEYKSKDFKYAPHEEEFKNRETSVDSRPKPWHTEFSYRKHDDDDDINDRGFSGIYQDRDDHKRRHDCSQEKARSPDRFSKNYAKTKERTETLSTSAYHPNIARFPLNGSSGQSFESDALPADPEQRSSKGFQRFLDVLNKGVNVDVLTKIVTQTSTHEVSDEHRSLVNAADHTWSPSHAQRQQKHHLNNNSCWSERPHGRASPHPRRRSLSPNRRSASDENSAQRLDCRESLFGSRSKSPSVEQMTLTPEDEQKHRQMQDVLQAIGVDLGFEELGQMSHRIQERLYGKKDADCSRKLSREQSTRERYSSNRRSRSSSSSGSNLSPLAHDCRMKKDTLSAQSDKIEMHQTRVLQPECGETSSGFVQDGEDSDTGQYPERSTAAVEAFPPNPSYNVTQPPVAPVMPTYSPINRSLLPFPTLPPVPPPGLFLPHLPPVLPYPHVPPPNIFPPVLAQTRPLFPPHISNPRPQHYSPPDENAVHVSNKTQKSKAQARPRCLQVIK